MDGAWGIYSLVAAVVFFCYHWISFNRASQLEEAVVFLFKLLRVLSNIGHVDVR